MTDVQFDPDSFAGSGLAYPPFVGECLDEHEAEP